MLCPSCGSPKHVMVPAGPLCVKSWKAEAYAQGRADERADVVAWLRGKAHDPTWLRAHGVQSRQGVDTLEEAAECIERGDVLAAGKVKP